MSRFSCFWVGFWVVINCWQDERRNLTRAETYPLRREDVNEGVEAIKDDHRSGQDAQRVPYLKNWSFFLDKIHSQRLDMCKYSNNSLLFIVRCSRDWRIPFWNAENIYVMCRNRSSCAQMRFCTIFVIRGRWNRHWLTAIVLLLFAEIWWNYLSESFIRWLEGVSLARTNKQTMATFSANTLR